MRIGIDFDNTIVCYDRLFSQLAVEQKLLPCSFSGGKSELRQRVRSHHGEQAWRRLQAFAYGPRMSEAHPTPGLIEFFARCRKAGVELVMVSHKTRFAASPPNNIDLREAAQAWLTDHGYLAVGTDDAPLHADRIFFEATRTAKLARIADLQPIAFIDDLIEVLDDPAFPTATLPLLYAPNDDGPYPPSINHCRHWQEVGDVLGL